MNCECMYYRKGATKDELLQLVKEVKWIGKFNELYPVALSQIDKKCKAYVDYDDMDLNNAKYKTISAGSLVLFAAGKYQYMYPIYIGHKKYTPMFTNEVKFTDLIEY